MSSFGLCLLGVRPSPGLLVDFSPGETSCSFLSGGYHRHRKHMSRQAIQSSIDQDNCKASLIDARQPNHTHEVPNHVDGMAEACSSGMQEPGQRPVHKFPETAISNRQGVPGCRPQQAREARSGPEFAMKIVDVMRPNPGPRLFFQRMQRRHFVPWYMVRQQGKMCACPRRPALAERPDVRRGGIAIANDPGPAT